MSKIRNIEINFPEPVEVPDDLFRKLVESVGKICDLYEKQNEGRVMWPSQIGQKMLSNPFWMPDDNIEFSENTLEISCSEREKYDE